MDLLHFNGPVWRPPFEATSQLLQVTAGCTHHRCKFCSLYGTQKFRMSPMEEIEADLKVIQAYQPCAHRVFLTGANPMVLTFNRLADIALLKGYLSAGIHYNLTYLTGLAGHGLGNRNAMRTSHVFSQVHPASINFVSLTLFDDSVLYAEMKRGK